MKIVSIFAPNLYSFQYSSSKSELRRVLDLWNNPIHLFQFVEDNKQDIGKRSVEAVVEQILEDVQKIDELIYSLSNNKLKNFDQFFKPLNNSEFQLRILSEQKGRRNNLRIYALRIGKNCYAITGGAIKFTQNMDERKHTAKELTKLSRCKSYLQENNVFDCDSFYGFLSEQL